jgi:hypothetical protein
MCMCKMYILLVMKLTSLVKSDVSSVHVMVVLAVLVDLVLLPSGSWIVSSAWWLLFYQSQIETLQVWLASYVLLLVHRYHHMISQPNHTYAYELIHTSLLLTGHLILVAYHFKLSLITRHGLEIFKTLYCCLMKSFISFFLFFKIFSDVFNFQ